MEREELLLHAASVLIHSGCVEAGLVFLRAEASCTHDITVVVHLAGTLVTVASQDFGDNMRTILIIFPIIFNSHGCTRQNYGKAVTKTRHMGLVPLLNRKCQKITASPKYVISCIILSFIVNSCLLFGVRCAIIITEDDSIVQLMTYLKGVHHDFC